ncbi:hypothetical protein [Streptomyces sp. NPDC000994]
MNDILTLAPEHLEEHIDAGRGADILSLRHRPSGHGRGGGAGADAPGGPTSGPPRT